MNITLISKRHTTLTTKFSNTTKGIKHTATILSRSAFERAISSTSTCYIIKPFKSKSHKNTVTFTPIKTPTKPIRKMPILTLPPKESR